MEMTASSLRANHEAYHPDSFFFSRGTMKFFGDSMKNYGVRKIPANGGTVWELYRKRPVKYGVQASAYFSEKTWDRIPKPHHI